MTASAALTPDNWGAVLLCLTKLTGSMSQHLQCTQAAPTDYSAPASALLPDVLAAVARGSLAAEVLDAALAALQAHSRRSRRSSSSTGSGDTLAVGCSVHTSTRAPNAAAAAAATHTLASTAAAWLRRLPANMPPAESAEQQELAAAALDAAALVWGRSASVWWQEADSSACGSSQSSADASGPAAFVKFAQRVAGRQVTIHRALLFGVARTCACLPRKPVCLHAGKLCDALTSTDSS